VKAALAIPGADAKQANALLEALDRPENVMLRPAFKKMFNVIIDPGSGGPIWKAWGAYLDAPAESCLARLGCTRESLSAAAAMSAAKSRPDAFGELKVVGELTEKVNSLSAELARLYAGIESTWTGDDVQLLAEDRDPRRNGWVMLGLKFTDGEVKVGDRLGERLVNWELNRRQAKAAA